MPAAAILKGLTTMNAVTEFLIGGSAADTLAATEFAAARKAFREIKRAKDKRGQVWVCIGHLNSCLEANRVICADSNSNLKALGQFTVLQNARLDAAGEKNPFSFMPPCHLLYLFG